MPAIEIDNLKILTLNCWGLRYFSDHRQARIKFIAHHIAEHNYDIVFLQEVWIQADFEYIRTKTRSIYKFAHIFNNASVLGTSGLVIMTKWIPNMIHFHPFSVNGTPFRPFHGDWFSTKGIAYARIELKGLNLHLFSTHMHAQYDADEKITDQYAVHRVCQSYELAKFVNLMACNCSSSASRDLIVFGGDMNACSREAPYKLLTEMTELKDCYKNELSLKKKPKVEATGNHHHHHHKPGKKTRLEVLKHLECKSEASSDEDLITCYHKENTFTPKQSPQMEKFAKRIDFLLYKLRDQNLCKFIKDMKHLCECSNEKEKEELINRMKSDHTKLMLCSIEQIRIVAKDISGLSFSDHQPVVAKFNMSVKKSSDLFNEIYNNSIASGYNSSESSDESSSTESRHTDNSDKVIVNRDLKTNLLRFGNRLRQKITEDHLKPLQTVVNMLQNQFFGTKEANYRKLKNQLLIHDIEELLAHYHDRNVSFFKYYFAFLFLVAMFLLVILTGVSIYVKLSTFEVILITLILLLVVTVCLMVKFITHRTEMNAVYAILSDIRKKRTFLPEYGLLDNQH